MGKKTESKSANSDSAGAVLFLWGCLLPGLKVSRFMEIKQD
jgi:hypothetical protein